MEKSFKIIWLQCQVAFRDTAYALFVSGFRGRAAHLAIALCVGTGGPVPKEVEAAAVHLYVCTTPREKTGLEECRHEFPHC